MEDYPSNATTSTPATITHAEALQWLNEHARALLVSRAPDGLPSWCVVYGSPPTTGPEAPDPIEAIETAWGEEDEIWIDNEEESAAGPFFDLLVDHCADVEEEEEWTWRAGEVTLSYPTLWGLAHTVLNLYGSTAAAIHAADHPSAPITPPFTVGDTVWLCGSFWKGPAQLPEPVTVEDTSDPEKWQVRCATGSKYLLVVHPSQLTRGRPGCVNQGPIEREPIHRPTRQEQALRVQLYHEQLDHLNLIQAVARVAVGADEVKARLETDLTDPALKSFEEAYIQGCADTLGEMSGRLLKLLKTGEEADRG